ncbi:Mor transcription activator family protein [Levilactobacillus tujiorum]|uniref:Mor transcription activator family protein n=1 Tax=Levilactobacillus tujiorum TaxID=2912243 RepID=UPI001456D9A1|nr:Mor transcription activator family protein [Levilactobacillus tujiorum]NLR31010.1 Mor transcription activator family protein [Levilactobacillus tujiorum]
MAMRVDLLQESYAQLYELLGEELTEKVYEMYRGRQISFPMRLYNRDKVAEQIVNEYDGHNLAQLTKEYDYSQRWIRQIIQKHREQADQTDDAE